VRKPAAAEEIMAAVFIAGRDKKGSIDRPRQNIDTGQKAAQEKCEYMAKLRLTLQSAPVPIG